MRVILAFISISFFFLGSQAQESTVECFVDKNSSSIVLYDSVSGNPVDTITSEPKNYCWIQIAITKTKDSWAKVKSVKILPACRENPVNGCDQCYLDRWIKIDRLRINIADLKTSAEKGVKFYSEPSLDSPRVHSSGKFLSTSLLEIENDWARVQFEEDGKIVKGWLQPEDQCALPWTSCPKTTTD